MSPGSAMSRVPRWVIGASAGMIILAASLEIGMALQGDAREGEGAGGTPVTIPADSVDLVFEREVFNYPNYGRRNPFRPLTGEDMGPRFEDLLLTGVLVSSDRSRSVATIGERPAGSTRVPVRHHRLREGEVVGNTRIIEIRERWVTVQVEEFGQFELRTLELARTAPEAMPGNETPAAPAPAPADTGTAGDAAPAPAPAQQGAYRDSPNGNGGWS